LLKKTIV